MGIIDLLLPREVAFFKHMNFQVENFCEACKIFREFVTKLNGLEEHQIHKYVHQIKKFESKGDSMERFIIEELDRTFITPLDREDIHAIATSVDDALDYLNDIMQKIEIYKIRKILPNIIKFANLIVDVSHELKRLIASLDPKVSKDNHPKKILKAIHSLEKEADNLFHNSLAELFRTHDPVEIIKFKDIYQDLEETVNSVDQIGSLVRGIIVKRG